MQSPSDTQKILYVIRILKEGLKFKLWSKIHQAIQAFTCEETLLSWIIHQ